MKTKISMPSVLSFEKKMVPSDGFLYGTTWETRKEKDHVHPLCLIEKSVRGTISHKLKKGESYDPAKLDAEVTNANLQVIDGCALALNQDTLALHFTLKILGNVGIPSACNNELFLSNLVSSVKNYAKREGFHELGRRYAINLANGRFFWRNRVGAENLEVVINEKISGRSWIFDSLSIPMNDLEYEDDSIHDLGETIAKTLVSEDAFILFDVMAYAKVGLAQEVYPSEELIAGKQRDDLKKKKVLYKIEDQAGMHSQKIGNALRTIDTWYPEYNQTLFSPIAIDPYGAVTTIAKAFRKPSEKVDFYTLFEKFVTEGELSPHDLEHYVMAVLIRGGVFGEKSKDEE